MPKIYIYVESLLINCCRNTKCKHCNKTQAMIRKHLLEKTNVNSVLHIGHAYCKIIQYLWILNNYHELWMEIINFFYQKQIIISAGLCKHMK